MSPNHPDVILRYGEAESRDRTKAGAINAVERIFAAVNAEISNQPGVSNFLPVGDTQALRVMPTVGLEYRYPFINVQPWGTTTVEPIAQVIIRPNESYAGKLPNEDAQSLTFDTSNLFEVDKFSGYDRVEGGGRANAGVQATTQFDHGGTITARSAPGQGATFIATLPAIHPKPNQNGHK